MSQQMASALPLHHTVLPFVIGGSSGIIATICTQPIDMIKVQLQLANDGLRQQQTQLSVVKKVLRDQKFLSLYQGLSAALLRQVVYGTSRLGLFFTFERYLQDRATQRGTSYSFKDRTLAGISAGALGALIGTPTEVALIRMQSDGLRPQHERAHYRSAIDALSRIAKDEGISSLWRGAKPTVIRAMSTNFGQLAIFSETKHHLITETSFGDRTSIVLASCIAGFCATFFSAPFDIVKTRLQRQSTRSHGSPAYTGTFDCMRKIAVREGVSQLYVGFLPYFMRQAPHTSVSSNSKRSQAVYTNFVSTSIITLVIADHLNRLLYRKP